MTLHSAVVMLLTRFDPVGCKHLWQGNAIEFVVTHYVDRVDDFLFFDCLSPFYFLLIEFHHTFSISFMLLASGRVDDLSFLEYLSPFCFLSIE